MIFTEFQPTPFYILVMFVELTVTLKVSGQVDGVASVVTAGAIVVKVSKSNLK